MVFFFWILQWLKKCTFDSQMNLKFKLCLETKWYCPFLYQCKTILITVLISILEKNWNFLVCIIYHFTNLQNKRGRQNCWHTTRIIFLALHYSESNPSPLKSRPTCICLALSMYFSSTTPVCPSTTWKKPEPRAISTFTLLDGWLNTDSVSGETTASSTSRSSRDLVTGGDTWACNKQCSISDRRVKLLTAQLTVKHKNIYT